MVSKGFVGFLLLLAFHVLPISALAAVAVAVDQAAYKFGYFHSKSTLDEAKRCAVANCNKSGGRNCLITDIGTKGGDSAIAAGSGQLSTFLASYEDESMVGARAMWDCQQKATGCALEDVQSGQCKKPSSCKIVAKWTEPEEGGAAPAQAQAPPPPAPPTVSATHETHGTPVAPSPAKALILKGNELFHEKRFDAALVVYTLATDADPKLDGAWYNRGLARVNMGAANYAAARDDFSKAISLNAKNDRALFHRAMLNKIAGQQQAYLADIKRAAELGNEGAKTYLSKASERVSAAPTPQKAAPTVDAEVQRRGKVIDPKGQGLNQAQIDAMEMQRRLMWNSTGAGMIYR